MSLSRQDKEYKKKMGQYMTPYKLSSKFISNRNYKLTDIILEPSFGEGSFLFSIIDRFLELYSPTDKSTFVLNLLEKNLYGVEFDDRLYHKTLNDLSSRYNIDITSVKHNLYKSDFFDVKFEHDYFDYIEGNPPFGGSFNESVGIKLDKIYGKYKNVKIKKETYSFFTHRCYKLLKPHGQLGFICSDTFLTIPTMKGIRNIMIDNKTEITKIDFFSEETNYPMVYFNLSKSHKSSLYIDGSLIHISLIKMTDNLSFNINKTYEKFFKDMPKLSEFITCSSGMTIGKNELFLKKVVKNKIVENYSYQIKSEIKTVEKEKLRARLGKISKNVINSIESGELENVLEITKLKSPVYVELTDERYKPYNKACNKRFFSDPSTYIYWENDGQAVLTFKKNGPWYLHGVGGYNFFQKELLTWRLISNDIRCRYLSKDYILDSGSPVGMLKNNIDKNELFFIIGWLNCTLATKILKEVINHTRNIQSKDIEKLPYPKWVSQENKNKVIQLVKNAIQSKNENIIESLDSLFLFH